MTQFELNGPGQMPVCGVNHLIYDFSRLSGMRTLVVGHRGGQFGPENSLKSIQGAINNDLEGIEFDVWLSKDKVPMVLHGGDNGELSQYGLPNERVFDWTSNELRTRIDIGEGEQMPMLQELIEMCQSKPNMLLNIELKGPMSEEIAKLYDDDLAAQKVVELIDQYSIGYKSMISSFTPRLLTSVINASPSTELKPRSFIIQSIRNNYGKPDPNDYETFDEMVGMNIDYWQFRADRVEKIHSTNNFVGLWYSVTRASENEEMWFKAFTEGGGVDFFFSDKPIEAMQSRDSLQNQQLTKQQF